MGGYKEVKWESNEQLWEESGPRVKWCHQGYEIELFSPRPVLPKWAKAKTVKGLLYPSVKVHEDIVKTIHEQLNELRNDMETKVK